jgi:MFS family permease
VPSGLKHLALTVYLPTLVLSFCNGLLLPVLPIFADSFEVSYTLIGLVLAGERIGTLLADVPAGGLLRRFGRKWLMVTGIALVGLSVLALAWSASIYQVLALRLIAGMGDACWNLSRHAYLTEATKSGERGRAIALFGGVNRMGLFAGPAVGGLIASAYGFGGAFVTFAVFSAVSALLVLAFIERQRKAPELARGSRYHLLSVVRAHYRVLCGAGSGQLLAQTIRASRQVIVPLYGASVLGLELATIGFIMSVAAMVDMSMFYPAGVLMDRWGRKYAIVPCFAIQALGMALLPLAGGAVGLALAASLIGFGNGLGSGTMMTLGADLAPKEALGEFLGVWRLIGDGGGVGAPLVVGGVADALDLPTAALVMAAFGAAAAAVFAFGVPETLKRTA